MANISKVPGTGGPIDPSNSGGNVTPKKNFDDLMKIDKTDPDQRRGKKPKATEEEEKKTEAILAQGEKIAKIVPGEKVSFEKKTQKIEKAGESEKRQPKQEKRTEEEVAEGVSNAVLGPKMDKTFEPSSKDSKKEVVGSLNRPKPTENIPIEESAPIEEESPKFNQKVEAPKKIKKQEAPKKETLPPPPLPSTPALAPNLLTSPTSVAPVYASLKPEVFALFERLVGSMSVMHTSGISETTIELNSSEFSTFAGAKIVITEHSSAPKIFNIEFLGNAQMVALFSDSSAHLMEAFKKGTYAFKVNRLDTSLLQTERPLFHRKDKTADKEEDQLS